MSSKKETGLALSKEAIQKEGIEIKLTQADIIDALVEEEIGSILSIAETLEETGKKLNNDISNYIQSQIDKAISKITAPKGLTFDGIANDSFNKGNYHSINVLNPCKDQRGTIIFNTRGFGAYFTRTETIKVRYKAEVSGVTLQGFSEPIDIKIKVPSKYAKLIEEYHQKVEEFFKLIPKSGINEKEIAKKIKNQFTKEILKTSSPDFQKKLRAGFGLSL